jgi:hypothetical protein
MEQHAGQKIRSLFTLLIWQASLAWLRPAAGEILVSAT